MNAIPQTCRSHLNRHIRVYLEQIEDIKGIIRNVNGERKKNTIHMPTERGQNDKQ